MAGAVTTVSTVDPIKVYFTVSETEYLDFHRRYSTQATLDAERKQLRLELILADGTAYPKTGNFYFADRQVNQGTGAIRVAGLFSNPGYILRPGEYGRVRTSTAHRGGRAADPTAGGDGAAGSVSGCGGGKRRQNRCSGGKDRRSRGQSVDRHERIETGGAGGGGRRAEGSARHDGASESICGAS